MNDFSSYDKNSMDETIKEYRAFLDSFRLQATNAINSWETYKKLQSEQKLFNEIFSKKRAINTFNIIQFSLIQSTWIALSKLWDSKTRDKNNVRFSMIYTILKPNSFYLRFCNKYGNDYEDIKIDLQNKISFFVNTYDKYTNGHKKHIYTELKNIRNNYLSHANLNETLKYSHTMDELDEFYTDSIMMLEIAYSIFGVVISLSDVCDIRQKDAESFVNILRRLSKP
ncbi:AbiU2 domain-containing protein [Acetobacter senegalensis]|uniref:AbiU2 domain-containing protein n=1 Tax=Acetobacter senegalensis TaxID=446692 RepID=UPI00128D7240|nr:hypothetical protein [Acetobacter senegalensis]MCG4257692.1 hypothetical protein [Acetobacter senegalensis]MCG4267758.1 hypothetical protein [Acetobacter senegalensis]MPQ74792.1 hypothetical protein [Acetobacter senegalensis]